ncbi:MAG: hypothetical protein AABY40_00365 [Nanoarchaeota archaeon]
MGKSSDTKSLLFWILGGTFVYYLLSQLYFAYLASVPFFSIVFGWFFGLPRYVSFIATLLDLISKIILVIATPLMYLIIGGLLGLLVRFLWQKYRK